MDSVIGILIPLIQLALAIGIIAGLWKLFTKAGKEGWKAVIPIYNLYVLLKIVGRPAWWLVLFIIPLINIIVFFVVNKDVADAFGKGTGFAIGLTVLPFIFIPMLGFGGARYQGAAVSQSPRNQQQPPQGNKPPRPNR